VKLLDKIAVFDVHLGGAMHSIGHWRTVDSVRHGQDLFLNPWIQPEHAHSLCYPCAGDSFMPGDFRLAGDLSGRLAMFREME
jgi:hypothetical protein